MILKFSHRRQFCLWSSAPKTGFVGSSKTLVPTKIYGAIKLDINFVKYFEQSKHLIKVKTYIFSALWTVIQSQEPHLRYLRYFYPFLVFGRWHLYFAAIGTCWCGAFSIAFSFVCLTENIFWRSTAFIVLFNILCHIHIHFTYL